MKRLFTLLAIISAATALMAAPMDNTAAADSVPAAVQARLAARQQSDVQQPMVAYVEGNVLHVQGVPDGVPVVIYAITGARVGAYTLTNGSVTLSDALTRGIYIVRAANRATKIVIK